MVHVDDMPYLELDKKCAALGAFFNLPEEHIGWLIDTFREGRNKEMKKHTYSLPQVVDIDIPSFKASDGSIVRQCTMTVLATLTEVETASIQLKSDNLEHLLRLAKAYRSWFEDCYSTVDKEKRKTDDHCSDAVTAGKKRKTDNQ